MMNEDNEQKMREDMIEDMFRTTGGGELKQASLVKSFVPAYQLSPEELATEIRATVSRLSNLLTACINKRVDTEFEIRSAGDDGVLVVQCPAKFTVSKIVKRL